MKKTPVDLQKRFPIYPACPTCLAADFSGSAFSQDGLAPLQDHDKVGVTLVDLERGIVPLRTDSASLKISRVIHTITFIL